MEKSNPCDFCNKSYQDKVDLLGHISTVHSRTYSRTLKCWRCEEEFETFADLKSHRSKCTERKENGTKQILNTSEVSCSICSKTYKSLYKLTMHMRSSHDKYKSFTLAKQTKVPNNRIYVM